MLSGWVPIVTHRACSRGHPLLAGFRASGHGGGQRVGSAVHRWEMRLPVALLWFVVAGLGHWPSDVPGSPGDL